MPLTAKGEKILAAMIEKYGEKRGKEIFYASKNKGTITGVDGMHDSFTLEVDDAARATIIEGGYLRAMPRVARTGIQIYHGRECGRPDVEKVRVYRPQDAVFGPDAIKSYTHLPVTIDHPGVPVDASNWKKYAVGETGDEVLRDGGTVRVPMMLRDAAAIDAVKQGKKQISVGYSCDVEWSDGITPDGEKYDAVQRNIRGNHVAIVSTARGGPELTFGDKGDHAMDLKTMTIDGITCQMDATALALVQKMQDEFELFKKKKKKGDEDKEKEDDGFKRDAAAKDATIKVKDAEIIELQGKLKDALNPKAMHDAGCEVARRDRSRFENHRQAAQARPGDGRRFDPSRGCRRQAR